MRGHGVRLLSCSVLIAAACATNPVTGKRELVLVSEAQEVQIGEGAAQEVRQTMGLYQDTELGAYVSELGMRLARSSERPDLPWQFHIVDSPVVNAFALPGGPVYLTRGILAHMNNEAAMVGILGHEIGHITARHSVQQISRSQLAGMGFGVGMIFLPEVRPFGDLIQTGLGLLFLKFSRNDEREADTLGVRYALAAGYDAEEMAYFFDVLSRLGEDSGRALPGWLSTHPDPEDRKERILQQIQSSGLAATDLEIGGDEFLRRLDGLVYGDDPRQGFMDGSRFKHPELRFQLDFPAGWNVENTPQAVYAAPPDGGAAIQLTASRVPAGTRPESYAPGFFQKNRLDYATGERIRISSFSAYLAPFRAQTPSGNILGEAGFVMDGELMYEILGYTAESAFRRYRNTFRTTISSYDRLRDPKALEVQADRIALYRVDQPTVLRDALRRAGVAEEQLEEMALVNNMEPEDRVEAGTLLKTVRRGGRR